MRCKLCLILCRDREIHSTLRLHACPEPVSSKSQLPRIKSESFVYRLFIHCPFVLPSIYPLSIYLLSIYSLPDLTRDSSYSPKRRWSEGTLVQRVVGRKGCWSEWSLIRKYDRWSENMIVAPKMIVGPKI